MFLSYMAREFLSKEACSPLEEYPKGEVDAFELSTPAFQVTPQEGNLKPKCYEDRN